MALDVSFDDVSAGNVKKLGKRYPEGTFDAYFSENRASDDRWWNTQFMPGIAWGILKDFSLPYGLLVFIGLN